MFKYSAKTTELFRIVLAQFRFAHLTATVGRADTQDWDTQDWCTIACKGPYFVLPGPGESGF